MESERTKFRLGDKVQWRSQAGGYTVDKVGVVVAIVPAGADPWECLPPGTSGDFGFSRDHESYLVMRGKRPKLYWPRVTALKLIEIPTGVLSEIRSSFQEGYAKAMRDAMIEKSQ